NVLTSLRTPELEALLLETPSSVNRKLIVDELIKRNLKRTNQLLEHLPQSERKSLYGKLFVETRKLYATALEAPQQPTSIWSYFFKDWKIGSWFRGAQP